MVQNVKLHFESWVLNILTVTTTELNLIWLTTRWHQKMTLVAGATYDTLPITELHQNLKPCIVVPSTTLTILMQFSHTHQWWAQIKSRFDLNRFNHHFWDWLIWFDLIWFITFKNFDDLIWVGYWIHFSFK